MKNRSADESLHDGSGPAAGPLRYHVLSFKLLMASCPPLLTITNSKIKLAGMATKRGTPPSVAEPEPAPCLAFSRFLVTL